MDAGDWFALYLTTLALALIFLVTLNLNGRINDIEDRLPPVKVVTVDTTPKETR